MSLRIFGDPRRHLLDDTHPGNDWRVAFTVCGIRFAWGTVTKLPSWAARCEDCQR